MDTNWLTNLKNGDRVILAEDGYNRYRRITTVRLTATQIIVEGTERRFDRQTGNIKGKSDFHAPYLRPYTEEEHLRIRVTAMKARLEKALQHFTSKQIEALSPTDCAALLHAGKGLLVEMGPPVQKETAP